VHADDDSCVDPGYTAGQKHTHTRSGTRRRGVR
jgi:hypothetical protein